MAAHASRYGSKFLLSLVGVLALGSCASVYMLDTDPPPPADAKWHPGHYALVYDSRFLDMSDDPGLAAEFETWVGSLPAGMVGIQGGAYWSNLEMSKGEYDFRLIDIQLAVCRRMGKRLFCTIGEKVFNLPMSPAPAYIAEELDGIVAFTPSVGSTARIWDPRVLERFCLLVDALGARYDADPYFEGIEFMETSFSCDSIAEAGRGYTSIDYVNAYKVLLARARAAFPTSVIIQETNFLPVTGAADEIDMEEFITYCAGIGIGIGGPDLYSDSERNPAQTRIPAYEYFPRFAGRIPLASDVQYPEYAGTMWYHGEKRWFGNFTPQGLLDMAINTLKLNYVFWCAVERKSELRFGFTGDVIPALERNGWAIHSGWPTRSVQHRIEGLSWK